MMQKITKVLVFFLVLFSGFTGLPAFEGLNIKEEGEISGFPMVRGVTDSGIEISIIKVVPEYSDDLQLRVERLIEAFDVIPVKSIRITLKAFDNVELYISNKPFLWKGVDMGACLSSGFTLKLDGVVDYDADVFVDRLHMRLEGFYESEIEFLDKIVSIVDDPGTFLMSRDPEYILNTFMNMTSADDELRTALEEMRIKEAESCDTIDELSAEITVLKAELTELKYNNLIMENRSLFGGVRLIDRDAVDWVVEQKTANPGVSSEELMTGVLDAVGSAVKPKELSLILSLYFGEYPE